jgi:hypothetical protein
MAAGGAQARWRPVEVPTHLSWDRGAMNDVVRPMIALAVGMYPPPTKTTKTQCGRRVTTKRIDNVDATCQACRAKVVADAKTLLELIRRSPELCSPEQNQRATDWALEQFSQFGSAPTGPLKEGM